MAMSSSGVADLAMLVGWAGRPASPPDHSVTEALLGTSLPNDFKELLNVFPVGEFAGTVLIAPPLARGHEGDLLYTFRVLFDDLRDGRKVPYPLFPGRPGLLPWARCYNGKAGYLFWLADSGDRTSGRWCCPIRCTSIGRSSMWQRCNS